MNKCTKDKPNNVFRNMTQTHVLPSGQEERWCRVLWQDLFNFYRERGGSMTNMDNILIDYENCKELFEIVGSGDFLFAFDVDTCRTTWQNRVDKYPRMEPKSYVESFMPWYDYIVHVNVTDGVIRMQEYEHPEARARREKRVEE